MTTRRSPGLGVGGHQRRDVVVGRVRPAARGEAHLHPVPVEVEGAAVEHHRHGLAARARERPSSSTSRRMAPRRSRHQPSGRDPITFIPSTIQRVRSGERARSAPTAAAAPRGRRPARARGASRRPLKKRPLTPSSSGSVDQAQRRLRALLHGACAARPSVSRTIFVSMNVAGWRAFTVISRSPSRSASSNGPGDLGELAPGVGAVAVVVALVASGRRSRTAPARSRRRSRSARARAAGRGEAAVSRKCER